jgi:hypothetical protein
MIFQSIEKVDEGRREDRIWTRQLIRAVVNQADKRPSYKALIHYAARINGKTPEEMIAKY